MHPVRRPIEVPTTLWAELAASWTQSMLVKYLRVNYDWPVPLADACQGLEDSHRRRDIHIEKPDESGGRILHAKNKRIYLRFGLPPILLKHYYNYARLLCKAEQKRLSAIPTKSETQTNDRMWFDPAASDVCLGTILVSKFEKCSENRAVWLKAGAKRPIHQSLTTSEPPTLLFAG